MTNRAVAGRTKVEGQVLVLFALCSLVLIGALALALDVGYLLSERRQAQSAVDAAALAGGVAVLHGESASSASAAAIDYLRDNGLRLNGPDAASVEIDVQGSRKDGRVEVEVTVPVQRFFVGAIYTGDWGVTARAVAEIHDDRHADYGLITFKQPGTKFNGNNSIKVINGSAMSNFAVDANPSNAHEFIVDGTIDSAGPIKNANGNWRAPGGMRANIAPIDDPLGSIAPPSPSGMDVYTNPCSNGCTWYPGVYRNGSVTIRNTITLMPGIYYFDNFDISFQNTNSRIEGNGVLLYFDEDSTFDPKNGEMYVTAAPSSLYPGGKDGMVFWYANCNKIVSRGNTDYYFEGIYYAPCADLEFRGTPNTPVNRGQMIVGSVDMRGTGKIWIDYNHLVDTRTFEVYLVE